MKQYKETNTGTGNSSFRYHNTRTAVNTSGIYCSICGTKMYQDSNMQYRCPSCSDSWTHPMNVDSQVF